MKVLIRIYDGELGQSTKAEILDLMEEEGLTLTGEQDMAPISPDVEKYHELMFEEYTPPEEEPVEGKE